MQRIVILGPCGAGKSTLAQKLGSMLDLPVIHLDQLNWQPGWVMAPTHIFEARVREAVSRERWIIDGNYSGSLQPRLERADVAVLLDFPRWRYIWQVAKRIFTYCGQTRPDMGTDCPERLDWEFIEFVFNFHHHSRPRMLHRLSFAARDEVDRSALAARSGSVCRVDRAG